MKTLLKFAPLKKEIESTESYTASDELGDLYLAQFIYAVTQIVPLEERDGGHLTGEFYRDGNAGYWYDYIIIKSSDDSWLKFSFGDPLQIEELK